MEQGAQLAELNGTDVWQHSNIYASGGRLVATYDAPSQPVPGYHYNLTDWLGTKRVQTTAGGGPQETCLSYPFGDGLACSGGTDATEQHFTGKDRDAESGLDYFYARYYNSNLGRFLTPDWAAKPAAVPYASYGNPQSLNLYAYVNNNPNTGIDVDGHVGNDGETFVSDDGPGGVDTMEEEEGMNAGISIDQVYSNGITMLARNYVAGLLTPPTPSGDDNLNPQQLATMAGAGAITAGANTLTCTSDILNAVNSQFGDDFTSEDIADQFNYSKGALQGQGTLNLDFSVPLEDQPDGVSSGRYPLNWWTYVIGYGPTLHIPSGQGGADSDSTLSITPSQFTAHIDSAYPYNPIGLVFHFLLDETPLGGYQSCPQ